MHCGINKHGVTQMRAWPAELPGPMTTLSGPVVDINSMRKGQEARSCAIDLDPMPHKVTTLYGAEEVKIKHSATFPRSVTAIAASRN